MSANESTDSWGEPSQPIRRPTAQQRSVPVPDNWDDDGEEDEDNQKIWDDANNKSRMPELIISASSLSPPQAALHPTMRILKRPAAVPSVSSSSSTRSNESSFVDREAKYNAARERIFNTSPTSSGQATPAKTISGSSSPVPSSRPAAKAIRNPRGPNEDGTEAGFSRRRSGKGKTETKQVDTADESKS